MGAINGILMGVYAVVLVGIDLMKSKILKREKHAHPKL